MQKYTSVQLEAKTELSNRCPRAQVEVCGYKGRLEAIYFTSFDFDFHESKLAHVHHILDKFSFN